MSEYHNSKCDVCKLPLGEDRVHCEFCDYDEKCGRCGCCTYCGHTPTGEILKYEDGKLINPPQ
jgi:hypothetical protein